MSELGAGKYNAWAYVLIGLFSIVLGALGVGALVLPPGIAYSLVVRGLEQSKMPWVVLGSITGAIWLVLLFAAGEYFQHPNPDAPAPDRAK